MSLFFISFFPVNLTSIKVFPQVNPTSNASFWYVRVFLKAWFLKVHVEQRSVSCFKKLHVQKKQCQFYFICWLQVLFITIFYCIMVFISSCVLFTEEHIVNLYLFLFISFFSVNLTSIIVLYNLTHISLILPSSKCFLLCILLVCRCSIVLLYIIRCSMAASPNHYYI